MAPRWLRSMRTAALAVALGAVLAQAINNDARCDLEVGDACLKLQPERLTFADAEQECLHKGGVIATPTSLQYEKELASYLATSHGPSDIWLGIKGQEDGQLSYSAAVYDGKILYADLLFHRLYTTMYMQNRCVRYAYKFSTSTGSSRPYIPSDCGIPREFFCKVPRGPSSKPTPSPTTRSPTPAPTTRRPTPFPTTLAPTPHPSASPTKACDCSRTRLFVAFEQYLREDSESYEQQKTLIEMIGHTSASGSDTDASIQRSTPSVATADIANIKQLSAIVFNDTGIVKLRENLFSGKTPNRVSTGQQGASRGSDSVDVLNVQDFDTLLQVMDNTNTFTSTDDNTSRRVLKKNKKNKKAAQTPTPMARSPFAHYRKVFEVVNEQTDLDDKQPVLVIISDKAPVEPGQTTFVAQHKACLAASRFREERNGKVICMLSTRDKSRSTRNLYGCACDITLVNNRIPATDVQELAAGITEYMCTSPEPIANPCRGQKTKEECESIQRNWLGGQTEQGGLFGNVERQCSWQSFHGRCVVRKEFNNRYDNDLVFTPRVPAEDRMEFIDDEEGVGARPSISAADGDEMLMGNGAGDRSGTPIEVDRDEEDDDEDDDKVEDEGKVKDEDEMDSVKKLPARGSRPPQTRPART